MFRRRTRRMMRRLFLIAAMLAAYALGSQAFAQESVEQKTTPTHPLTDQQKTDWSQFIQAESQQRQELQAIVSNALNVEVGPTTSIQFHTNPGSPAQAGKSPGAESGLARESAAGGRLQGLRDRRRQAGPEKINLESSL